jgi:hypothetical protein
MSVKASVLDGRNGREASVCEGSDVRGSEFIQGHRRARKLVYGRTAMGVKANECRGWGSKC